MSDLEQMRAEFEDVIFDGNTPSNRFFLRRDDAGDYVERDTDIQWFTWQAAIAAERKRWANDWQHPDRDKSHEAKRRAYQLGYQAAMTQQGLDTPKGWKLVPVEPTPEIMAAASIAAWPTASAADIDMAKQAARIVLTSNFGAAPGMTLESIALAIATMAPAYRAMIAAAPMACEQEYRP